MPSARLGKRPALGESGEVSFPGASKVKLPRLERGPEDFSQVVKEKLQFYTRTGQACDRCKVRKIRCDGLPEGCSPCAQQNLECCVTDRVTGRTERRGYLEELEHEKMDMMTRLRDMEQLLEDRGIQVRPWQWTPPHRSSTSLDPDDDPSRDQWTKFFSLWIKDASRQPERSSNGSSSTQQASPLQTANPRTADACLGGAAQGAPLCSINNANANSTPASQFATHFQHNLAMTVKQEEFGSAASRRPSLQSNSTTPSSMLNAQEQLSNPCHNPSMTAPTAAYPQTGYAGLTQSAISTPTSASSSMQSSYMPAVTGKSPHQYSWTLSAAASVIAATQTHHHQQQGSVEWMITGPGVPNGMPTLPQVQNGGNSWHEWTSAIAMGITPTSQDRYSVIAPMRLDSEQRGRAVQVAGGGRAAPSQGSQGSMMMAYDDPNHT